MPKRDLEEIGHDGATAAPGRLLLAGSTGGYAEHEPLPPLQPHFSGVWLHSVPRDAAGRSAVVPDGHADLVWSGRRLYVAGPDRQVAIEAVPPGTTVVGLRFRPAAALRWLKVPLSEITDRRLPLDCFWGTEAQRLSAWIGEAGDPAGAAERLQAALAARSQAVAPPDAIASTILAIVGSRRDPSAAVMRQLIDGTGISARTLRRRCHEAFGYGPKTLDRITRFQRFLQLARRSANVALADLALDAGYADQAHLTRESRAFAALTPAEVRQRLGAGSDIDKGRSPARTEKA